MNNVNEIRMETKELISIYVTECIEEKSSGFTTDFGIGKFVSAHVFFHVSQMVVSIRETKESKDFPIDFPNDIVNWIYEKII